MEAVVKTPAWAIAALALALAVLPGAASAGLPGGSVLPGGFDGLAQLGNRRR